MPRIANARKKMYIYLVIVVAVLTIVSTWIKKDALSGTFIQRAIMYPDKDSYNLSLDNSSEYLSMITSPNHPNCLHFRQRFPLVTHPDGDLDVAFTMVVHKDPLQIARLLRMIHRVNNYYCVHLDVRSPKIFVDALKGVANCFGVNVELVPYEKRVAVKWGDESVLRPQLICAEQALRRHSKWKYLVNIVGQDFPLRTNLELVAALKALNGSNLVESFPIQRFKNRVQNKTLPFEATWYKGTVYGAFRRDFLYESVMGTATAPIRQMLLQPNLVQHPDELFFNTLAYNPYLNLPGACLAAPAPLSEVNLNFPAKYVVWGDYGIQCPTKYVRFVCILGTPHLSLLRNVSHLFANKFHSDYHPEAYDELEKWYFEKVAAEIRTGSYAKGAFNVSFYANRFCSMHHL